MATWQWGVYPPAFSEAEAWQRGNGEFGFLSPSAELKRGKGKNENLTGENINKVLLTSSLRSGLLRSLSNVLKEGKIYSYIYELIASEKKKTAPKRKSNAKLSTK